MYFKSLNIKNEQCKVTLHIDIEMSVWDKPQLI